jgi:hypothetical protein
MNAAHYHQRNASLAKRLIRRFNTYIRSIMLLKLLPNSLYSDALLFDRLMKISLMITVFIALGISGCATQPIRSVTIFSIQGRVLDKESNFPLEKVNVYFIDTGFDYTRSKKQIPIKVAESDSRGKIDARLNYLWERRKTGFNSSPKGTLDIVLSKDRYETQTFHFKESELITDGIAFLINLKDVYMLRATQ